MDGVAGRCRRRPGRMGRNACATAVGEGRTRSPEPRARARATGPRAGRLGGMITILAAAAVLVVPTTTFQPAVEPAPSAQAAGTPDAVPRSPALKALMDEHFEALLRRFPEIGAQFGD